MIKKLQKKIIFLVVLLFSVMWVSLLLLFNLRNYQNNLWDLKNEVRSEITSIGWKEFIRSHGEKADLKDIRYCVLREDDEGRISIYSNHFPGMRENKILQYGKKLSKTWRGRSQFWRVTYLVKRHHHFDDSGKKQKCIVLISGEQAFLASLPEMIGSTVIAAFGILVLTILARTFSRRLVEPVDHMIRSEKEFMSNTSHELKTPLTVISANAELLEKEIGPNRHLQYIRQETDRMISMVGQMLTLMHLDTPELEQKHRKFRADEALLDVIYPMESIAYEKKLRLDTKVQENMQIIGDEEQLKSVMSILLDNAISYSPEGGRIYIESGIHSKKFYLNVENSGEPIPEEIRGKLFERFYRQDEAREETENHFGLGLSIAGSIVSKHHGKIWAESKDGRNIFKVLLPTAGR